MVISLVDACLLEIRKGLENGTAAIVRNVHGLPLGLRQRILDVVLMHGTINNPSCLATLSTAEFLTGFTSLNTQSGRVDDHEFLDRVVTSMASILPNGEQLGATIEALHLNFYKSRNYAGGNVNGLPVALPIAPSLQSVLHLVSMPPNLAALKLHGTLLNWPDPFDGDCIMPTATWYQSGLLNKCDPLQPYLSVIENLSELSVTGYNRPLAICTNAYPIMEFKRLTSLQLIACYVHGAAFHELLNSVRETLTILDLENVEIEGVSPWALPFPFPHLTLLAVKDGGAWQQRSEEFVGTLTACPQLKKIELEMNSVAIDESHLSALTRLNATLSVVLRLNLEKDGDAIFETASSFRHVSLLGGSITGFRVNIGDRWDLRLPAAVAHLVDMAQNLTSFGFGTANTETPSEEVLRGLANRLTPLFANKERAAKLRELSIDGPCHQRILYMISKNCTNLDSFSVGCCPQLIDRHLSDWAGRGVSLKRFDVYNCENVSSDGVIPVLINSGNKLERFVFTTLRARQPTLCMWTTLIEHCRRIQTTNIARLFGVAHVAAPKCLNKVESLWW